jgi:hypothetical protein
MRTKILRRVDALESEERSRQSEQQSSWATIFFFCWKINFAYYLGGLKPDDEDPGEAEARALNYKSRDEYLAALLNGEKQEINKRFKKAARRLFAQADLDFDRRPARVLFAAFVRMIEELPEQWFNWLNSNLQEECRSAPMGTESQTPHEFFFCRK